MKKVISLILAAAMMLSVAACEKKEPAAEVNTPTNYELAMVTGGTSGTYYAFGGIMANVLTSGIENVSITASTSGASVANARSINSGEADLAILQNDVFDYAYNGTESFAQEGALKNVATIGTLYPEVIQIVAAKDSGIASVADLVGKKVSVGDVGSGTEANARQILSAYGLTYDDMEVSYLGFGESSSGIQNRTLDAAFVTAGVPNPAILELNASLEVTLVPVDAEHAATLAADYPYYLPYTISDGDYEGITGVDTVAILATLACRADLDEEVVYNITKALFENKDTLAEQHAKGAELDPAAAVQGVSVPFHPGAEKYYKEIGVL